MTEEADNEYDEYDDEALADPLWVPKDKVPYYGRIKFGGGVRRKDDYTEAQSDALLAKLRSRAKWGFIPELSDQRTAAIWMLNKGLDPAKYQITMEDLDGKKETPADLIIKKDIRLFSAGGYRLKSNRDKDVREERIRRKYLMEEPDKRDRDSWKDFKKKYKTAETKTPSERMYSMISLAFKNFRKAVKEKSATPKQWLADSNFGDFAVGCQVNKTQLTAPSYFTLLQSFFRTFKNCVALPILMKAFEGTGTYMDIDPNPEAAA
jgi:hypothetical protein